jgi:hypothetical protein
VKEGEGSRAEGERRDKSEGSQRRNYNGDVFVVSNNGNWVRGDDCNFAPSQKKNVFFLLHSSAVALNKVACAW